MTFMFTSMAFQPVSFSQQVVSGNLCIQKAQPDRENAGNTKNYMVNVMVVLRNTTKLNILGSRGTIDLLWLLGAKCDSTSTLLLPTEVSWKVIPNFHLNIVCPSAFICLSRKYIYA